LRFELKGTLCTSGVDYLSVWLTTWVPIGSTDLPPLWHESLLSCRHTMRLAHLELLVLSLSYLIAADRRISPELRTASDNTLQQQNQGGRTPRLMSQRSTDALPCN
jgi:hypothetical protein